MADGALQSKAVHGQLLDELKGPDLIIVNPKDLGGCRVSGACIALTGWFGLRG